MTEFNIIEIESSKELEAIESIQLINDVSKGALESYDKQINFVYDEFWFNGDPILKVRLLGTKAKDLFTRSAVAQEGLRMSYASVGIDYTARAIPEKFSIEWNNDGSAVITEKNTPPVEEEEIIEDEIIEE